MSFFDSICVLSLLLTVHYHNAGCTNSFSVQGVIRSNGLSTLLGGSFKSNPQSLSLDFKSANNGEPFADDQALTASEEDNDDLPSSKISLNLLESDRRGESEVVGSEDSSFVGSREKNIEDGAVIIRSPEKKSTNDDLLNKREKAQNDLDVRETITKMTLHNILSQPENKPLGVIKAPALESISAERNTSGDKATNIGGRRGNEKKTEDGRVQKREITEAKETITASGSSDTNTTANSDGSGAESKGEKHINHGTTFINMLVHEESNQKYEEEAQGSGEPPEFSGKEPLAIFFGTSGSGDGQHSDSGNSPAASTHPVTTLLGNSNKLRLDNQDSNEGSTLAHNDPLQTDFNRAGHSTVQGEDEKGSGMSFDPLLLIQIRKIRMNVLQTEKQAAKELNDVRRDFRLKMEDLQEDLKMVRKLTSNVHKKVGLTVNQALAMARQAKTNATNRLYMAQRATTALNNIEKRLGVIHTRNASRILRSRIPQFPQLNDVALYKQLLKTDAILTKLDGAKELAIYRAEKRFRNEEETGSSIAEEVVSLRDELASAEKELSDETDAELEDEREAQEKIEEAMQRNKLVAKKTAFALMAIENYLQKLQSDESKLKRLRFY